MAGDQKKAIKEGRTLVFVDQAGFALLPAVVRTSAPMGQTPLLRVPLTREHLSAMTGITPDGHLTLRVQDRAVCSPDVVRFLHHLGRHLPGPLLILWDGAPIHRSQGIKDFLAHDPVGARIHLERFPGYAPELNPAEGIWRYLKYVELKNLCCHDLHQLRDELRKAKERLRHKAQIIQSCIQHTGLY